MSPTPDELYAQREGRFNDVVAFEQPDRLPRVFIPMHRGAGGFPDEAKPENVMALREAADEYGVFQPQTLRRSPTRAGRPNPAAPPRSPFFFERRARPLVPRPGPASVPLAHVREPVALGHELGVASSATVGVGLDLTGVGAERMVVECLTRVELRAATRARVHLHRHDPVPLPYKWVSATLHRGLPAAVGHTTSRRRCRNPGSAPKSVLPAARPVGPRYSGAPPGRRHVACGLPVARRRESRCAAGASRERVRSARVGRGS